MKIKLLFLLAGFVVIASSTPPTVPTSLVASPISATEIDLSWTASTSSIGIAGYRIYRNGVQIATSSTTAWPDTSVTASTTYTYSIAAYDTAANLSGQSASIAVTTPTVSSGPTLGTCPALPSNNVWNTPINTLPVDPNSGTYVSTIGATKPLHPDFSSDGYGIPFTIVPASQPRVVVNSDSDQDDLGPYPIPPTAQVESGSDAHVLVVDEGNCKLYELWLGSLQSDGTWTAGSRTVFDLNSNILRPSTWTSADAAGLPILPGLIRYEEVAAGHIDHAIRMTAPQTRNQFIWPARHQASNLTGAQYPPMGERFRLKASFDITKYSAQVQVVLTALKTYGAILADNGSSWYLTGAPDPNWNDSDMHNIAQIVGSDMEAVNTSSLQVDPNSGTVTGSPLAISGIYLDQREANAGDTVNAAAILTAPAPTGGAVISFASSNSAAVSPPASATIPAGATSVAIPLTIHSILNTTPVVLSATYQSITQPSAVLFVNGTSGLTTPLLSALLILPTTVSAGTSTTGTVTLTIAAPAGGTVIALSSSNSGAASAPASVTVPSGATSGTFPISTYSSATTNTVTIAAKLNGEALAVPVTVLPGSQGTAPVISSFGAVPANILSGQSTTLSWTVSGSPTPTLSIDNGIGTVTGTSVVVSPTTTTTYTLTAANSAGSPTATTQVTVTNSAATYTLTLAVSPSNSGTVTPSPLPTGGTYLNGTKVCLAAAASAGWQFSSWSGSTLDSSNCVVMNGNLSVTANFAAIPPLRFVPMTPCRVVDTRYSNGAFGSPALAAGATRSFVIPNAACGIPTTAAAYSLNVAVVPKGGLGYLTGWPSGHPRPVAATLNSLDGRIKSVGAVIPAGNGGAISMYATNATDLILDISGYFVPATVPSALAFYPVTPCRVADTRNPSAALGGPYLVAKSTRAFPILSAMSCNIPSSAHAYSVNLAVVPRGGPVGYLTAWPTGQTQPVVATLNDPDGVVLSNAAILPAGNGGQVDVYTTDDTDLVIDINGYFAPFGTGGLSLYNLTPCRVLDTRQPPGSPPFTGTLNVNVEGSSCAVPGTAQAYIFNATVVPPGKVGYLTLWPQGTTRPVVANLNDTDGTITGNMAVVSTANGSVSAYVTNPTHLVLDIFGYFAP